MSDYIEVRYELYKASGQTQIQKEGFFVKKFKKAMALSLALAMGLSLAACGGSTATTDDSAADTATEAPADDTADDTADDAADDATDDAADDSSDDSASSSSEGGTINLWTFTDEVPGMVEKFKEANPDFNYDINTTVIATTDGAYQPALDQALSAGGEDAPDMYCAESAFVLKYTQGDMASFACPYEDAIRFKEEVL